jgi:ABC-2 type transport system permease protein
MAVFSFSFVALFSGLLVAGDRKSAFLLRLFASPMTARDFIFGYVLPTLPIALIQAVICFAFAALFGLRLSGWLIFALAVLIPTALMYTFFGLLFGSLLSDRQLGGILSIFVNVTTWFSGTWFDTGLIGGAFKTICDLLPFSHAVELVRAAAAGNAAGIFPHLGWVLGYTVAAGVASVLAFRGKMKA